MRLESAGGEEGKFLGMLVVVASVNISAPIQPQATASDGRAWWSEGERRGCAGDPLALGICPSSHSSTRAVGPWSCCSIF